MTTISSTGNESDDGLIDAYAIQRSKGGRVFQYQEVVGKGFSSECRPIFRWLADGENAVALGLKASARTCVYGWRSIPGIIESLPALIYNLCGGLDVTKAANERALVPDTPEHEAIVRAIEKRRSLITAIGCVLAILYIAFRCIQYASGR